jgi:hypothetical protein
LMPACRCKILQAYVDSGSSVITSLSARLAQGNMCGFGLVIMSDEFTFPKHPPLASMNLGMQVSTSTINSHTYWFSPP